MSSLRHYEILLPLKFNDGQPVPWEIVGDTLKELRQRFGAVSFESQTIVGIWQFQGIEYRDELVRVFVDVEEEPENREFFKTYKEQLKSRFRQHEIWMTAHSIDAI